jgi:hypothetical protein
MSGLFDPRVSAQESLPLESLPFHQIINQCDDLVPGTHIRNGFSIGDAEVDYLRSPFDQQAARGKIKDGMSSHDRFCVRDSGLAYCRIEGIEFAGYHSKGLSLRRRTARTTRLPIRLLGADYEHSDRMGARTREPGGPRIGQPQIRRPLSQKIGSPHQPNIHQRCRTEKRDGEQLAS